MAEVGLVKLARVALRVGQAALPAYVGNLPHIAFNSRNCAPSYA
jgi:hypothetical protein